MVSHIIHGIFLTVVRIFFNKSNVHEFFEVNIQNNNFKKQQRIKVFLFVFNRQQTSG